MKTKVLNRKCLTHILESFPEFVKIGSAIYVSVKGAAPFDELYDVIPSVLHYGRGTRGQFVNENWRLAEDDLISISKNFLKYYYTFPPDSVRRTMVGYPFLKWIQIQESGEIVIKRKQKKYIAHYMECSKRVTIFKGFPCKSEKLARKSLERLIRLRAETYLAPWYEF